VAPSSYAPVAYPPVYYPVALQGSQMGPAYAVMPPSAAPYAAADVPLSPALIRGLTGNDTVPVYQPDRPSWTVGEH
jgi:hypothetical protein